MVGSEASLGIGLQAGVQIGESTHERIAREHKIISSAMAKRIDAVVTDKAKADELLYNLVMLLRHGPRTPDAWRGTEDQIKEVEGIRA